MEYTFVDLCHLACFVVRNVKDFFVKNTSLQKTTGAHPYLNLAALETTWKGPSVSSGISEVTSGVHKHVGAPNHFNNVG